jgi:uncharacterized protein (TIGR03067 family)
MKRWLIGVIMLACGAATAGDAKKDLANLQGTWLNELEGKKHELKITKDGFTLSFAFGEKKASVTGTFKIDPTKSPKHMDLTITAAEGVPDKFKGKTSRAIYAVDGTTLKWYANQPGEEARGNEFPDKEGGQGDYLYLIFKRAAK